jgi:hypothetical protein
LLDEAFLEVPYDTVGDAPLDEVQLGDGGRETLELDTGRPAKGIEELLRVAVQTRLVGHVDREHLAVRRGISHVLIL